MTHRELIKKLYRLHKALEAKTSAVNRGGCAVMAAIIGEALQGHGVTVEVVTPQYGAADKVPKEVEGNTPNRDDVDAWDRNGINRGHLAIRFKSNGREYTWDSEGLIRGGKGFGFWSEGEPGRFRCEYPFGDGISVNSAKLMSANRYGWNSTFDRSQIPLMKNLVAKYFPQPSIGDLHVA